MESIFEEYIMAKQSLVDALEKGRTQMSEKEESALSFVLNQSSSFSNVLNKEAAEDLKKKKDAKRLAADQLLKREVEKQEREAAELAKKLRESLSEYQFLLSDMTNGRLPESGIDHVMFRYPKGTWGEEHDCNIPEVDLFHFWDAEVLEGMWLSYTLGEKCLLVGLPGTGKTSSVRQLAAWIRQPFARFNGKGGIEPASFLGYPWATADGMEWKDGLMPQAVSGGYLAVIDEVMKLPPTIQMALQSLYEKDGFLMLDEKPGSIEDKHIHPRQEFRLYCTDNSKGTGDDMDMFAASQMQDISTLDRFGVTLEVDYLPRQEERKMIAKKHPHIEDVSIKSMVAMANLVREALSQGNIALTLSPRGLDVICGLLGKGLSLERAINLSYINKLGDDREIKAAKEFMRTAC